MGAIKRGGRAKTEKKTRAMIGKKGDAENAFDFA